MVTTQNKPPSTSRRWVKYVVALFVLALIVLLGLMQWRSAQRNSTVADTALLDQVTQYDLAHGGSKDTVQRGKYLAQAADCIACHSVQGGKDFAGGLRMATPFGVIVSSNITPDKEHGIGSWSEEEFIRAIKQGVAPHGKLLYPAMPYNLYAVISDQDIKDIFAYLKSIPPVPEAAPPTQLPFPFNIRQLMFGWNLLFFNPSPFKPDSAKSVQWNRGAYLVDGVGHCAACHSGKNLLGANNDYLLGNDLEGWHAPELSGNTYLGIGSWNVQETVNYLHNGGNRSSVAAGSMGEVVSNSTQYLNQDDLKAIAVYLKSLPGSGQTAPAPLAQTDQTMLLGHQLFQVNCAACHASNGQGVDAMVASLANSPGAQAPGANNLIRAILLGGRGAATQTNPTSAQMPAFAWKLSDVDAAAIATYVRNTWGNAASAVSDKDVASLRTKLGAAPLLVHR
ncbi:mono/diheme cytochrome c family protein [Herbaspirillum sp. Sphag1AN]|uniref:cytochrome c n=1 Tax=unclassified Herbaspirillum TaxID=2624150 RepID=UPI0016199326|nr:MULTISPECIES: c-type cytochrome [unclassified Herbaspirillum]MBB3211644.1 mono/diheme cytochrome c family protein [Herbaspirillum sp. Sphag1AN]MBB3245088.1 mono/diheme cytochrome c family protein [Herbaspirillum sp. Sphag64]